MSPQPTGSHPRIDTWPPYGHYGTPKGREKISRIPNSLSLLGFSSHLANVSVNAEAIFVSYIYCVCTGKRMLATVAHVDSKQLPGTCFSFYRLHPRSYILVVAPSVNLPDPVVWQFYECTIYFNYFPRPSLIFFSSIPMPPPHSFIPVPFMTLSFVLWSI